MSVVENLFNDNVPITITGGVELTANLIASPWNRTTVADGYWLQTKTVDPFSARDIYLANCIDDALNRIENIETDILNGTSNSIGSMNNVIYSANDYWENLPASIAPSNTSQVAPSNTLTYMTLGEDSDVATDDISLKNDRTCLIQGNLTENSFNQILLTDSGMFYRSVSGDETAAVTDGDKVDSYDVLETSKEFSQILDDSTIDSAGYWFLHKESSGRPVWTNINALGEYIDNRVNPDQIYVGWDDGDPDAEYPERKLILFPPTEGLNTTSSVDPTSEMYMNDAYVWTENGWAGLPSLMSREEITETIDEKGIPSYSQSDAGMVLAVNSDGSDVVWTNAGGGGNASLKDFLSLFTANGARSYYTNSGARMISECDSDGNYYYEKNSKTWIIPNGDGKPRTCFCTPISGGEPGMQYTVTAYNTADLTEQDVNNYYLKADLSYLASFGSSGLYVSHPVYIELAPFVFTNEGKNLPREWHIHFSIKGKAKFWEANYDDGFYQKTPPALVDVSIVTIDANQPFYTDSDDYVQYSNKTFYITRGDSITTESYFITAAGDKTNLLTKITTGTDNREIPFISKTIDYYQTFSAGEITTTAYKPYLRVCVKGLSAAGADSSTGTLNNNRFAVNLNGYNTFSDCIPRFTRNSNTDVFIEEFNDDRFMDMAYRYVNDLPTRMLSYTDENSQANVLGINNTNISLTSNTNILGQ